MADAAIAPTAVDATNAIEEPTRTNESTEASAVAEAKPADGDDVAPADAPAEGTPPSLCSGQELCLRISEQAPEAAAATDDQAAKDESTDAKPDTTAAESNRGESTCTRIE